MTIKLDPDRTLALAYVPAPSRPAVEALWDLDSALASVLSTGKEPLISQIRLAWWREALEKLDTEKAPAEPVLLALAGKVVPAGVRGSELAQMEAGWAVLLLPDQLAPADLELYASARGGLLFRHTARLLGGEATAEMEAAGAAWAAIDLARHSADAQDADAAVEFARIAPAIRWPSRLRPLGMLAALARRDADAARPRWEQQGAPGRMLAMVRHRLTGR